MDEIAKAAKLHKVPEYLLRGVGKVESQHNPTAVSPKGARGEFQIMPRTARELGLADGEEFGPKAAGAAAKYLAKLYKRFGHWDTALEAYNAGPARVAYRAREDKALPEETLEYVAKNKALHPRILMRELPDNTMTGELARGLALWRYNE